MSLFANTAAMPLPRTLFVRCPTTTDVQPADVAKNSGEAAVGATSAGASHPIQQQQPLAATTAHEHVDDDDLSVLSSLSSGSHRRPQQQRLLFSDYWRKVGGKPRRSKNFLDDAATAPTHLLSSSNHTTPTTTTTTTVAEDHCSRKISGLGHRYRSAPTLGPHFSSPVVHKTRSCKSLRPPSPVSRKASTSSSSPLSVVSFEPTVQVYEFGEDDSVIVDDRAAAAAAATEQAEAWKSYFH